jgi:hypothetical protein
MDAAVASQKPCNRMTLLELAVAVLALTIAGLAIAFTIFSFGHIMLDATYRPHACQTHCAGAPAKRLGTF